MNEEKRKFDGMGVFVEKGKTSHSQEIVGNRLQEELGSSD